MSKNPGDVHRDIAGLCQEQERGLTVGEIRAALMTRYPARYRAMDQAYLDRRVREVPTWWEVQKIREGANVRYCVRGLLKTPKLTRQYSMRVESLALSTGRCAYCGKTVAEDGIRLHVDHKIPINWGGSNEIENLQALCSDHNQGKKDYLSDLDPDLMTKVMARDSVHEKIAVLLRENRGNPVSSELFQIATRQEDWHKRLRELRYLGWVIRPKKRKLPDGRVTSSYILEKEGDWPEDMTEWIRAYEKDREQTNKLHRLDAE